MMIPNLTSPSAAAHAKPGLPVSPTVPADPAKLRDAARAFEAMAIGALLTPMFETVDLSNGPFGGGAGEAAWKPMLIEQMAKKLSQGGGLGLARPIQDAMLRMQEARNQ